LAKGGNLGRVIVPLALSQFICSFAGSALNVSITDISSSLNTDVTGVQSSITFFTLTMAALMIPGSKLTDVSGRKKIYIAGLAIYAIGALIAALAPALSVLIFGYSLLQGLGTAFLIPPVYILATVLFSGVTRAKAFGLISAGGGIGSAIGPLIGGTLTTAVTWRATFILEVLVMIVIIILGLRFVKEPPKEGPKHHFDVGSAALSAIGLVLVVVGLQTTSQYGWLTATKDVVVGGTVLIPVGSISPFIILAIVGLVFNVAFYYSLKYRERKGKEPLIQTRLFHNKTSNLGLVTQNFQWLILQGIFFGGSVFFQTLKGFSAINTGLTLTSATIGILITSAIAGRLAALRATRVNIRSGFLLAIVGIALLLAFGRVDSPTWYFFPGFFVIGAGFGIMLTASVVLVQSQFPDKDQGEISGLSRSISNLGSSFGVSIIGSIIVMQIGTRAGDPFFLAFIVLMIFAVIGMIAAILIPKPSAQEKKVTEESTPPPKENKH
jgi:MFS family permease